MCKQVTWKHQGRQAAHFSALHSLHSVGHNRIGVIPSPVQYPESCCCPQLVRKSPRAQQPAHGKWNKMGTGWDKYGFAVRACPPTHPPGSAGPPSTSRWRALQQTDTVVSFSPVLTITKGVWAKTDVRAGGMWQLVRRNLPPVRKGFSRMFCSGSPSRSCIHEAASECPHTQAMLTRVHPAAGDMLPYLRQVQ